MKREGWKGSEQNWGITNDGAGIVIGAGIGGIWKDGAGYAGRKRQEVRRW